MSLGTAGDGYSGHTGAGDGDQPLDEVGAQAERCHQRLELRGETVATAESLTGGLLGAALTAVPRASTTFAGGMVAYTERAKRELLHVPTEVLTTYGPVHAKTVSGLATGARDILGSTYGLATTGVAGPSSHGGQPVGTVYLACAGPAAVEVKRVALAGDRAAIRQAAVSAALALLLDVVPPERAG